MRIAAGAILVAVSTLTGFLLSVKYTERKRFYTDFYSFNKRYLECVSFSGDSVKKLLAEYKTEGSDFYLYMREFIENNNATFQKKYLRAEESAFLKEFADSLGRGDYETEKKKASASLEKVKEKMEKSLDEEKKFRPLLIKLGFLFGGVIFILII